MPAEWEKHSAVWLAWPHDEVTFPGGKLKRVEKTYIEILKNISQFEDVELLVLDNKTKTRIEKMLTKAEVKLSKISFHITDYADVWIRDFGPTFIINKQDHELAWIKWHYNAYGNKFPELLKDNEVFFNLRRDVDKRMFEPGVIMEGGAIETNGQGVLITTEQCLLNKNRNPQLNKNETEKYLNKFVSAKKVIWLKQGLMGDHTDGHIDELARFVSPNKIVCAYEENTADENYKALEENFQTLAKVTNLEDKPFEIVKLPMPHMKYKDGTTAPVSYCNFYIGNGIVLAATFKDPSDAKALEILQSCFPDHKIVGIDCSDIIYGGGAIHCITQQQPLA